MGIPLDRYELGSGVHAAFTDRRGGVSKQPYAELNLGGAAGGDDPCAVAENRARVAAQIGVDSVAWMHQVHQATVARVDGPPPDGAPRADALVTDRKGVALAVRVADCTPVLLADSTVGVLAAVHAGRPGLAARVVPAAVAGMVGLGAAPDRIVAVIGPAVCGRCYEVPAQLRAEVVEASGAPQAWATTSWGTPAVDVAAGVLAQLSAAGVGQVDRVPVCTMESPLYFSYRRDGETGRFAGYVWADR